MTTSDFAARAVAFDTETHLGQPGLAAPPLVCASTAWRSGDKTDGDILDKTGAIEKFRRILDGRVIVGANIAYDLSVMLQHAGDEPTWSAVFAALEDGRVYDVLIGEALIALWHGHLGEDPRTGGPMRRAGGKPSTRYSLEWVSDYRLDRQAKVNDRFRKSYALLETIPIDQWPADAGQYPVDDAINTLDAALSQVADGRNLHDMNRQVRADFAYRLSSCHGIMVDPGMVRRVKSETAAQRAEDVKIHQARGFYRADGSKDSTAIKAAMVAAYSASDACPTCAGRGKVPGKAARPCQNSRHTCTAGAGCRCRGYGVQPLKNCKTCDGSGADLDKVPVPRTDKGGIATGRDALYETGDDDLIELAAYAENDKYLSTYIPWLERGISDSGSQVPITLSANIMLANGRTSYDGVVQLLPRDGAIRECIVPRPGHVFCSCDYSSVELGTHAQSCLDILGFSALAEALQAGIKPHDSLASEILGVPYETFLARRKSEKTYGDTRQASKPANFGFPGGMSELKLVWQQRKQGPDTTCADGYVHKGLRFCVLMRGARRCGERKVISWGYRESISPTCEACLECAAELKAHWFARWPENREYFKFVKKVLRDYGYIIQHRSNVRRGGVGFCDAANGYFSRLAADGMKDAIWRVCVEQYRERRSPLFGTRTIVGIHDELIVEMREDIAHDAAQRLSEVMVSAMQPYTPDVPVEAEPALMRRFYKGAEPVFHEGRLVPWEPPKKAA